jgi:hypothetical protein
MLTRLIAQHQRIDVYRTPDIACLHLAFNTLLKHLPAAIGDSGSLAS